MMLLAARLQMDEESVRVYKTNHAYFGIMSSALLTMFAYSPTAQFDVD
jgi:hypothetical protein